MEDLKDNYPYNGLDTSLKEIRLIELLPCNLDDSSPVQARLIRSNLNTPLKYEALSYVWGDSTRGAPIQLDNERIVVTVNLERALRYLSLQNLSRTLWIDAICINQNDIAERNHQVSIMREIYEQATEVLVWFGEGLTGNDKSSMGTVLRVIDQLAAGQHFSSIAAFQTSECAQDTFISAFRLLLQNSYWERTWVLQETSVGRHATLIWGADSLGFDKFLSASRNIQVHTTASCCSKNRLALPKQVSEIMHEFSVRCRPLHRIREHMRYQKGPSLQLWELLSICWPRHSTDLRDKVYGILGLVTEWPKSSPLSVDYSLEWPEVFRKATFQILTDMGSLHLLVLCSGLSYSPRLPSWVPDLSRPVGDMADLELLSIQTKLYNASGSSVVEPLMYEGGILAVWGIRIDSLSFVYPAESDLAGDLTKWWDSVKLNRDPSIDVDIWKEIFLRTVIADLMYPITDTPIVDGQSRMHRRANKQDIDRFKDVFSRLQSDSFTPRQYDWKSTTPQELELWVSIAATSSRLQHCFTTSKYKLGMGPKAICPDDEVWILLGSPVPFVLRPHSFQDVDGNDVRLWSVVGSCFLHGIMDGEVFDEAVSQLQPDERMSREALWKILPDIDLVGLV